jgi:hypothetical protein
MWKVASSVSRLFVGLLIGIVVGYLIVLRRRVAVPINNSIQFSEVEVIKQIALKNINSSRQQSDHKIDFNQTSQKPIKSLDVTTQLAPSPTTAFATSTRENGNSEKVPYQNKSTPLNHLRTKEFSRTISLSKKFEDQKTPTNATIAIASAAIMSTATTSASPPLSPSASADTSAPPLRYFHLTVPNIKHHHRHPANLSRHLHLFYYAMRNIENATDLVYINGPRGKRMFDVHNTNPHLLTTDKLNLKSWHQLATLLNDTVAGSSPRTPAVHVHNEMKIGDVLLILVREYCKKNRIPFPKPPDAVHIDRALLHQMMDYHQPPMVVTNTVDENWGFLSTCTSPYACVPLWPLLESERCLSRNLTKSLTQTNFIPGQVPKTSAMCHRRCWTK